MKILVTGGAGFIGSHIVDALVKKGIQVSVLDNLSTGLIKNINPTAKLFRKDIRDVDIKELFLAEKFDCVIHEAAQTTVSKSLVNPYYDCEVNILGLVNLLEASRVSGVKRFVFASSAAVYGDTEILPIAENCDKWPTSFYAESKLTGEHYLEKYYRNFGLEYVILRYANVYGERQADSGEGGVISIFLKNLLLGNICTVYGDGNQTRDYVYVKDVAEANCQALVTNQVNRSFNISTGIETSLNELIAVLGQLAKQFPSITYASPRSNDIKRSVLDNRAAQIELSWKPVFSLEAGLYLMMRELDIKITA